MENSEIKDVFAKTFMYLGSQVLAYKDVEPNSDDEDAPCISIIYHGFSFIVKLTLSKSYNQNGSEWVNELFDKMTDDEVARIIEEAIPHSILEDEKREKLGLSKNKL